MIVLQKFKEQAQNFYEINFNFFIVNLMFNMKLRCKGSKNPRSSVGRALAF